MTDHTEVLATLTDEQRAAVEAAIATAIVAAVAPLHREIAQLRREHHRTASRILREMEGWVGYKVILP